MGKESFQDYKPDRVEGRGTSEYPLARIIDQTTAVEEVARIAERDERIVIRHRICLQMQIDGICGAKREEHNRDNYDESAHADSLGEEVSLHSRQQTEKFVELDFRG